MQADYVAKYSMPLNVVRFAMLIIFDVEMVMKTYGHWIPDHSTQSVHNWGAHLDVVDPLWIRNLVIKSNNYMVEAAGVEPLPVNSSTGHERQPKPIKSNKKSKC